MKIKLSKSQWELVGVKTGWIKSAGLNRDQVIERIKEWNVVLKQEKDLNMIRTIKETLNTLQEMLSLIDLLKTQGDNHPI